MQRPCDSQTKDKREREKGGKEEDTEWGGKKNLVILYNVSVSF